VVLVSGKATLISVANTGSMTETNIYQFNDQGQFIKE
jgi:hypothetical protein